MALPGNVNLVRVRGYWFAQDGTGYSGGTVKFVPAAADLTDMSAFANIETATVTVTPDPTTGYYFADLIATDDPDLTAFAWQVTRTNAAGVAVLNATIAVPYNSPTVDVGAGLMMPSLWLVDAATTTVPPTSETFYTSEQTDAHIAEAIAAISGGAVVGDATTSAKGIVRLAGDLSGTAASPTVPALKDNYGLLVQEVVDRQVADGELQVEISKRYEFNPAVGIPERDLSTGVVAKLNTVGSGGGSSTPTATGLTAGMLGDRHVAEDAGIAESKVALAADAHPSTPSRRTLGSGARQAMPGNTAIPVAGTDVPPLVAGVVPASFLPDGSVAGAPLNTTLVPSPLGNPTPGTDTRSSPADHVHARPAVAQPADHGLIAWSFDPVNTTGSATSTIGTLQLVRMWIPRPLTITGIILSAVTGGTALTNCYTALFDASKNLLAQSGDRASAWGTSTGDKKGDLATPQNIASPGFVYAGFWVGGGTSPAWAKSSSAALGGSPNNLNLTGTALRFSTANIGLTTTAPSTASAQTSVSTSYLVGLY